MKKIKNWFSNWFCRRDEPKTTPKTVKQQNRQSKRPPEKKISPKPLKEEDKTQKRKPSDRSTSKSPPKVGPKKSESLMEFSSRLTAQNGSPPNENIYDVCAYVLLCVNHDMMALAVDQRSGYVWLPFVSLHKSRTWTDGALDGAYIVLSGGDANIYANLKNRLSLGGSHCMQIFRLQLPQTQRFNTRLIYCVKLESLKELNAGFNCCTDNERIKWFDINDINRGKVKRVWGPEVKQYCRLSTQPKKQQQIEEYSLDQAFYYVPRDPPRNLEEELLRSTNYTEKDVERIYGDFIEHCFPAFYMSRTSFIDYMMKYGFEKDVKTILRYFSAFNFSNSGHLNFSEFLIGLTSIEPNAFNGQSRIKFVFKYYNVKKNGFLSQSEFEEMVRQIHPKDNEEQIQRRVEGAMKRIGLKKEGVAFDDFFKAVGSHQFRGTSSLCRNNRRIVTKISASMAARSLAKTAQPSSVRSSGFKALLEGKQYKGVCKSCKEKKYDFAIHVVKLNADGHCVDSKILSDWNTFERSEKSESEKTVRSGASVTSLKSETNVNSVSPTNVLNLSLERFSKDFVFNPKFAANFFIRKIREFNLKKGSHKENKGLMEALHERPEFIKKLEELCNEVEHIFQQEDRCVSLTSPAFVIGDVHGNLEDLLTMERVLWKSIPIVSANYLFLGDYVDRGKWSIECAIYVLCLKMLAPTKVFILRGNHEVRDLQIHYTYKKECLKKYGDNYGSKAFDLTNKVFDKLPVCAVIDDAIYCAHGGIPRSTRKIDDINKIKVNLRDPERESALAWQILWSDPIGAQQFAETAELLQVRVDLARGFLTNTKRGTAFLFSEEAINNFLQTNGLTHVIRAHEVPAHGYQFHFGNKCTTIFSCSHYCGNDNEAACVHIDQEKLRIVRLDTKNNAPPCD